jgi:Holliday junction resolvase RusA-like endonuclease
VSEWCSFEIPDPISVNAMYRNVTIFERQGGRPVRGRAYTTAYKNWRDRAILEIRRQLRPVPHCPGPFYLDITLSGSTDIDNAVKCIPDLLKHMEIIVDDSPKYMVDLHVHVATGPCMVAIRPMGEWA